MNAIAYFSGRDPAFAIMGDLIAGYDTPEQYQDYCMHGGGKDVAKDVRHSHARQNQSTWMWSVWQRSVCRKSTFIWC